MPEFLTGNEVAQVLGVSKVTINRWVKNRPDFPKPLSKNAHSFLFSSDEVKRYAASLEAA